MSLSKINLNAIRRAGMHDDGVFNDCQLSDQEFDDEIASIDSQTSMMDHNVSNDLIDCQMNSKNDDDDNDDDDYVNIKIFMNILLFFLLIILILLLIS